jgi:type I restriction enzyme R subunit
LLTDLVSLVRYALQLDEELTPHSDVVGLRFDVWLAEQQQNGRAFTTEQIRWLEMFRNHIATSLSIEPEDFDLTPFAEEGGIDVAYATFGKGLNQLIEELNTILVEAP